MRKPEIPNIYKVDTQLFITIKALSLAGDRGLTGKFFLQNYIPEYRSRINEARKDGYIIKREREAGSKFVRFVLVDYAPLFKAVNE